jgi:hypothetical protein
MSEVASTPKRVPTAAGFEIKMMCERVSASFCIALREFQKPEDGANTDLIKIDLGDPPTRG